MAAHGKIALRYCGGCNPRYDRIGLVEELKSRFPHLKMEPFTVEIPASRPLWFAAAPPNAPARTAFLFRASCCRHRRIWTARRPLFKRKMLLTDNI